MEYRSFSTKEAEQASGEFTFEHYSTGKGNITFTFEVYIYSDNYYTDLEIELSENYPYTECIQPTSWSLSPSIQKPGGDITFSWNGAKGGTANSITGYKVSYSVLDGEKPVYTIEKELVETSEPNYKTTWTLPDDDKYRGKTIQVSIQVIGTILGYDSEIETYSLGKINTKPILTLCRPSKTIVPSRGGEVSFALESEDEDSDSQTLSYYYETDSSSEKVSYTNGTNVSISDTTTFNFYAYDGLEYSEAKQIEIEKNTEPSCKLIASGGLYTDYRITCELAGGQPNDNKFTYYLSYDDIDVELQDEGQASYLVGDIRAKLGSMTAGQKYSCQFWATRDDGIETCTSDKIDVQVYAPVIVLKNELNEALSSGTPYFSKNVKVEFTGYSKNINTLTLSSVSVEPEDQICVFNTTNFKYGEVFSKMKVNDSFELNLGFNIIKTSAITIGPVQGNSSLFGGSNFAFRAYTDPTLFIYIKIPSEMKYGFSAEETLSIKLGNGKLEASYSDSSSDETGIRMYSVTGKDFYDTFIKNATESGSLELNFELKNKYGDTFSYSDTLNINYEAPATINNLSNLNLNVEGTSLDNWAYLKEGMPLSTNLELYSVLAPSVDFLYKKSGTTSWQFLSKAVFTKDAGSYRDDLYNTRAYKYVCNGSFYEIGANEEDFEIDYGARVSTGNHSYIEELYSQLEVRGHKPPIVKINKASILNSTLTTTFDIDPLGFTQIEGINFSKQISLEIQNSEAREFVGYKDTLAWSLTEDETKSDFLHVSPILKTSFSTYVKGDKNNLYYQTEKISQSKFYFLVYNIVPTVSYRKNHLGINTLSPSERDDSVVYVGSYGERDKIYFVNSENQIRTIDIKSGGINGFIVDCGSWTGIPGGLIPTNPDLPAGLATIAYTGDIKDLEQKTETIIVLSGGSSEI